MRRWIAVVALLAPIATACSTSYGRGRLAAASDQPLPVKMTVIAEEARGRSCGGVVGGPRYQAAIEDALRNHPGANALVDATHEAEGLCITVRGRAVHVP